MNTLTKKSVIAFYLEFVNDWLTIERMAEHYEMPFDDCKYLLSLGSKYHIEQVGERNSLEPIVY